MPIVFDQEIWVHYGQFYVQSRTDDVFEGLTELLGGQANGLCGAAVPGQLFLTTGLHTGHTRVTVEVLDAPAPIDDEWEDVVEASFRPATAKVVLAQWGGEHWPLALAPIDYRVRYSATGMDRAHEEDTLLDGEPLLDRYLLQFWPAPPAPDAVIRETSQYAAYWHAEARTLPSPPVPRERSTKNVVPSWVPADHTPGRRYDQAYANRLELHEWAAKRVGRAAGADGDFLAPVQDRPVLPLPEGVGGGWGAGTGDARFPFVLWGFRGGDLTRTPQLFMPTVEKPEYSEEARKAKLQGTVVLWVEVDPTGRVINPKVIRGLGLGLDERAIEAIQKWKFSPGLKGSEPVTVALTIEVYFRLECEAVAPSDPLAAELARLDPELVDGIANMDPASQRAVAVWVARRACAAAGLSDLDWVRPVLAALERGESLPFDDLDQVFRLLRADPHVRWTTVTSYDGRPNFSQQHIAVPALWSAAADDPLRAGLESLYHAIVTFGTDYRLLLSELRDAFPELA